ncbi:MAG TPA: disulfide isomerase DsbC N-terminal domain-containing protein [Thermodesulfovibrionales bacterium]|jgi:thiol:disulfide interchange protein DsbC|nr:disulfide isomerase DsbC N-terminal domain-containing protein [Thermodesulfovibrionales bacterium]
MQKFFLAVMVTFLLLPFSNSYGFSEKGQDCSKCHTLSKDEALSLLKELDPNLKVLEVRTLPVQSLWEVSLEGPRGKGVVYLDFSKKYLISGQIIALKEKRNLTQERSEELNRIVLTKDDVSKIPVDDALVMGDKDAKHKVIVFDDPE